MLRTNSELVKFEARMTNDESNSNDRMIETGHSARFEHFEDSSIHSSFVI